VVAQLHGAVDEYSFGPSLLPDGRVRFRLWAPACDAVGLVLDGHPPLPMVAEGDGFFTLTVACPRGSTYRFRVGALDVPDPASRQQDGDVHDASVVPASGYAWQNPGWQGLPWPRTVLYEVHVGLLGGFRGVQERLPDLADLGVTALELMPVADFSGPRNWGYDGVLPYAPDGAYGTPDDLRQLVDTAHGLGIQMFLDVVYNHFGPDGNYLHTYAPHFFRDDVHTPWGPAIDFRRPQVREFFAENALYWLREYRFDGLRLDAVHAIAGKDWLVEMAAFVRARIEPGRHVHLVLENDDNDAGLLRHDFDAQWNDDLHHVLHHLLTGESHHYYADYAHEPAQRLARCLAEGFDYQGQPSPFRGGRPRGTPSKSLPPTAFVSFLQNHDQTGNRTLGERLATLCVGRPAALRAAIALQLLAPHIPLIFMGEEYGATAPFLYFTSFENAELARAVFDGRRREHAVHEDGAMPVEVPDPNARTTWEASRALAGDHVRHQEWRALYAALLGVRHTHIVPRLVGARSAGADAIGPAAVAAAWVLGDGSLLRLYCNLGGGAIALPGPACPAEAVIYPVATHSRGHTRPASLAEYETIATLTPGGAL